MILFIQMQAWKESLDASGKSGVSTWSNGLQLSNATQSSNWVGPELIEYIDPFPSRSFGRFH